MGVFGPSASDLDRAGRAGSLTLGGDQEPRPTRAMAEFEMLLQRSRTEKKAIGHAQDVQSLICLLKGMDPTLIARVPISNI